MTYQDAVNFLQKKCKCHYDYFNEQSFNNLKHRNFRTKNGNYRLPNDFLYQRKKNLVYCNLLEHLILHALIFKETKNGKLGIGGYKSLPTQIENLYLVEESQNEQNEQAKINHELKSAIGLTWPEVNEILVASKALLKK